MFAGKVRKKTKMVEHTALQLVQQFAHSFFRYYFLQSITLFCIFYLMFSGRLKLLIDRVLKARKLKAGPFEANDMAEEDTDTSLSSAAAAQQLCRTGRRKSDVCASHAEMIEVSKLNSFDIAQLLKKINKMDAHLDELWINSLRQGFYNEYLPLAERMYNGLKYVYGGGNSQVEEGIIKMVNENPEIYTTVVRLKPQYALGKKAEKLKED